MKFTTVHMKESQATEKPIKVPVTFIFTFYSCFVVYIVHEDLLTFSNTIIIII